MNGNLAETIEADGLELEQATVMEVADEAIVVLARGQRLSAQRAPMCLLEPRRGDAVMLAVGSEGCFVIGVLARQDQAQARLSVSGDLEILLRAGRFVLAAQQGVEVATAGEARTTASRWTVRAPQAELLLDRLSLLGTFIEGHVDRARLCARAVDVAAERLWQRLERAYRFVAEFDQLRAGHIDHRARHTARIHADNSIITADKLAKVDAEQIHVG